MHCSTLQDDTQCNSVLCFFSFFNFFLEANMYLEVEQDTRYPATSSIMVFHYFSHLVYEVGVIRAMIQFVVFHA